MGTKYNKKRDTTVRIHIKFDESMENDLRILYGLDKRAHRSMSFNDWLVLQMHDVIERNGEKLEYVKKALEPRLVVNGVERNIV